MKMLAVIGAALALALSAAVARAGVVLDEEQTISQGSGSAPARKQTIMIEGHKEKIVWPQLTAIIDLDKPTMLLIDEHGKAYIERPFPPRGAEARMFRAMGNYYVEFPKRDGTHDKALGYTCDNYSGAGQMPAGAYTAKACFSKSAPGAGDYTAFHKEFVRKLKNTDLEMTDPFPPGIPLISETSIVLGGSLPKGAPPPGTAFVEKLRASSVKAAKLADNVFLPPPDFKKREGGALPIPGGGGGPRRRPMQPPAAPPAAMPPNSGAPPANQPPPVAH